MIREVLRTRLLTAVLVAPLLAICSSARAQTPTATTAVVTGTVVDASGAVVPGATVVLTDPSTNRTQETVTNPSGHYAFGGVLPGTYEVTVTLAGKFCGSIVTQEESRTVFVPVLVMLRHSSARMFPVLALASQMTTRPFTWKLSEKK